MIILFTGFLDAFTDGKTIVAKHGKKLAKV